MKIEIWPLSKIRAYPKNARNIPQAAIDKVALSLRTYSWRQPMVVEPDGTLIVGHVRLLGALQNGWTEGPVHVATDLTPAQIKAYRLMDNRSHDEATWNLELIGPELLELQAMNFDLAATGFSIGEIGRLLPQNQAEPEAQMDRAEELLGKWKVERGQVWEIGEHRLMCGDATNGDAALLMRSKLAHAVYTDPPYGVDYDGGTTVREKLTGDTNTALYDPCCKQAARFSDEKAALYLWHAGVKGIAAAVAAAAAGYAIRCEIVWNKNLAQFGSLSAQYKQKHEPLYYCYKKGYAPRWYGPTNETTVWDCQRASVNDKHPTQKPVELAVRALCNSTEPGHAVLDLFAGSGSTMVAAQQLNRRCYGMEIEPKYCAVILERMSDMGLTPRISPL